MFGFPFIGPCKPRPFQSQRRPGLFFWAGADGGINLDRAGGVVRPSQPAQEAPAGMFQLRRGLSFGLAHVVNSRREGIAVDFKRCW